ncbi:MAG: phenylalanine--tRNA ligase subunit beta, partial [Candidatus Magasanikbacteria bacterium]|nr:phenylalanine--tRNA ligase subunit beta [Candidatus Magasanikbacteria bacterium]
PDLWGMRGMAREFGAVLGAKVTLPAAKKITGKNDFALDVKIEDSKLCTRYQAVVIDGVSAGVQSPTWMQARLNAAGVRPINAIVDVTNYVMLEGAQPLHAFDFDAVKDKENHATIFVRGARGGETLATLDGQKHELPTGALVIATKKDVIGIAGIMGGVHHSIGAATKTIVIESAHFAASSIRQTSMKMHLRTESSSRFEKGLDVYNTEWGIARAVELLKEIFPKARVASSVIDEKTALAKTRVLDLSAEDLQRAIGGDVELSRAKKILESLGFDCVATAKKLRVTIPTFRMKDIVGTHDLIEEIVRLFGFENITSLLPAVQLRSLEEDRVSALRYSVKELCALRHGFTEVNTYGYVRPQTLALFGYAPEQLIELANPLSAERPFLAPTLAINLAEVVEKNSHSRDEVAVFEIAKIFKLGELIPDVSKKEDRALPAQPTVLGIALSGKKATNNFARVRETVQSIFRECGYELSVRPMQSELAWSRVGHAAEFFCDGVVVGYIGSMNSAVRSGMGIEHETVIAEINLSELFAQEPKVHQYKKTGNFPHSIRDIAVVVSEQITAGELSATVLGAHQLVQSAEIFDIFRGEKIGAGKKAVALHVTYRA